MEILFALNVKVLIFTTKHLGIVFYLETVFVLKLLRLIKKKFVINVRMVIFCQ